MARADSHAHQEAKIWSEANILRYCWRTNASHNLDTTPSKPLLRGQGSAVHCRLTDGRGATLSLQPVCCGMGYLCFGQLVPGSDCEEVEGIQVPGRTVRQRPLNFKDLAVA